MLTGSQPEVIKRKAFTLSKALDKTGSTSGPVLPDAADEDAEIDQTFVDAEVGEEGEAREEDEAEKEMEP